VIGFPWQKRGACEFLLLVAITKKQYMYLLWAIQVFRAMFDACGNGTVKPVPEFAAFKASSMTRDRCGAKMRIQ
jgi:hypothetical protein